MSDDPNAGAAGQQGASGAGAAGQQGASGAGQQGASGAGQQGQQGGAEPWYASLGLDEEARQFIAGKGASSAADAMRSWISADRLARERNVLPAPDVNALADWRGWEALGWTPDAAKYKVDLPEAAKDLPGYETFHKDLVEKLHAQRVPLPAAKALAGEIAGLNQRMLAEVDAQLAREKADLEGALKREWGGEFDRNREIAARGMKALKVGEADAGELDALLGSARMVKLFHEIGRRMGEDAYVSEKGGTNMASIDQARAQKAELEADPVKRAALMNPAHPQHQAVKDERERLQRLIFDASGRAA